MRGEGEVHTFCIIHQILFLQIYLIGDGNTTCVRIRNWTKKLLKMYIIAEKCSHGEISGFYFALVSQQVKCTSVFNINQRYARRRNKNVNAHCTTCLDEGRSKHCNKHLLAT